MNEEFEIGEVTAIYEGGRYADILVAGRRGPDGQPCPWGRVPVAGEPAYLGEQRIVGFLGGRMGHPVSPSPAAEQASGAAASAVVVKSGPDLWPSSRGSAGSCWSCDGAGARPTLNLATWSRWAGPFGSGTGEPVLGLVSWRRVVAGEEQVRLALLARVGADLLLSVHALDGTTAWWATLPGPWPRPLASGASLARCSLEGLLVVAVPAASGSTFHRFTDEGEPLDPGTLPWAYENGWTLAGRMLVKSHWADQSGTNDARSLFGYDVRTLEPLWSYLVQVPSADRVLASTGPLPYNAAEDLLPVPVVSGSNHTTFPALFGEVALHVAWLRAGSGELHSTWSRTWPAAQQTVRVAAAANATAGVYGPLAIAVGSVWMGWGIQGAYTPQNTAFLTSPRPVWEALRSLPALDALALDSDGNLFLALALPRNYAAPNNTMTFYPLAGGTHELFHDADLFEGWEARLLSLRPDGAAWDLDLTRLQTVNGTTETGGVAFSYERAPWPSARMLRLVPAGGQLVTLREKPGAVAADATRILLEGRDPTTGSVLWTHDLGDAAAGNPGWLVGGDRAPGATDGWVFSETAGGGQVLAVSTGGTKVSRARAPEDVPLLGQVNLMPLQGAVFYPWQDTDGRWYVARLG